VGVTNDAKNDGNSIVGESPKAPPTESPAGPACPRCRAVIAVPLPSDIEASMTCAACRHVFAAAAAMPQSLGLIGKRLGPAAFLAAAALFLPLVGSIALFAYIDTIGAWLRGHGIAGLALYAAAFAILAGLAILPTYASAILGGWAFGFALGLPGALCGFLGGALIGYTTGRLTARDRVNKMIKEQPRWDAVRGALVGSGFWKTLGIVTLIRVPPNSPFAFTNLLLSSLKTNLLAYTLGTMMGMLPRTAIVIFVASQFKDLTAAEAAERKPIWLVAGGVVLAVLVLCVLGAIAKRALDKVTGAGAAASDAPR
jgi:uncharacterized membrane protein YdjX (TVP38/TMEM64 family)